MSQSTDPVAERPEAPRSIVRATLTGMIVGSALSVCNIYSGLKVGWSPNMGVTSALVSYGLWRLRGSAAQQRSPFSLLETNLAQTGASAAAAVSSAGLVAGIPALTLLTGTKLSWPQLAAWVLSIVLLGNVLAVPLRRQMLIAEPLPFPMGLATAETLKQMYARGREATLCLAGLGIAAVVSAALKAAEQLKMISSVALPGKVSAYSLRNLTFSLDPSLLLVGMGGLMSPRAMASTALGAVLCYGVIAPRLLSAAMVRSGAAEKAWYQQIVEWTLWPGVTMMVVASLTSLALSYKSLLRGFRGLGALGDAQPDETVPQTWFRALLVIAVILSVTLQIAIFAIPWWAAIMGVALSALLAVVASRVAGETGLTPIGGMGKVTQLAMGAMLPGNVAANLMTANVTGGSASQCADMMNDLKTGQVLGASPRTQFISQVAGAIAGALLGTAVYLFLIPDPAKQLLTDQWPAPAVLTWKTVAEVFREGLSALPPKAPLAIAIAAVAGILLSVAEAKAPPKVRKWVPSPAAIGLSFVVPANQAVSLVIGGTASLVIGELAPSWHKRFWVVLCAGLIAGEGLTGAGMSIYGIATR